MASGSFAILVPCLLVIVLNRYLISGLLAGLGNRWRGLAGVGQGGEGCGGGGVICMRVNRITLSLTI
jgi:hypothetical protein